MTAKLSQNVCRTLRQREKKLNEYPLLVSDLPTQILKVVVRIFSHGEKCLKYHLEYLSDMLGKNILNGGKQSLITGSSYLRKLFGIPKKKDWS